MLTNRRAFFYATPREAPTHAGHTAPRRTNQSRTTAPTRAHEPTNVETKTKTTRHTNE